MALLSQFLIICIVSFGIGKCLAYKNDVMDYGAAGDGRRDDSIAFIKAWNATCGASGGTSIMAVPGGKTFLVKPVAFYGPCKCQNIQIQISGNLLAPLKNNGWSKCQRNTWIYFSDVNGLSIYGNGTINGQGHRWWKQPTYLDDDQNAYDNDKVGCDRPTALRFHRCNGLSLSGLTHRNSPRNHISISNCDGVSISNIHISAPEKSPNTDGIDITQSTQINIRDSNIETGDDCVAINTGCSNINITGVSCGPGHGLSVGSLGAHGSNAAVEWIRVNNCTFTGTTNGGRVKTWPGGSGYARNIYYDHIILDNVQHPIIIDQHYCNGSHNCPEKTKAVKVSDVYFSNVRGTTRGKEAIILDCSSHVPCNNIVIDNVHIGGSNVYATCKNARGRFDAIPKVYCN